MGQNDAVKRSAILKLVTVISCQTKALRHISVDLDAFKQNFIKSWKIYTQNIAQQKVYNINQFLLFLSNNIKTYSHILISLFGNGS